MLATLYTIRSFQWMGFFDSVHGLDNSSADAGISIYAKRRGYNPDRMHTSGDMPATVTTDAGEEAASLRNEQITPSSYELNEPMLTA